MSRLIDADALERDGWEMRRIVRISKDEMELQTRKPTDFPAIEDAPTIEPQRMRGKWIGGELGRCSVCGHEGDASDIWNGCKGMFCPNCGSDMRETE